MNQRKFLHLLNLYIDGEIPSAEAAELEREIIANPRRRKIYDDYCRIHRATRLVYERFREAAASPSIESVRLFQNAPGSALAARRDPRPRWMTVPWLTLIGGGAAAASIALAFMIAGNGSETGATAPGILAKTPVSAPQPEDASFAAPFATPVRSDPYLAQEPVNRASPFSLDSADSAPVEAASTPAPILSVTSTASSIESQISSPFGIVRPLNEIQPVLIGLPAASNPSDHGRVFRGSDEAKPVELEPVGFLIHR